MSIQNQLLKNLFDTDSLVMVQSSHIITLAKTQINKNDHCIAGLTKEGKWLRPKPIYLQDVASFDSDIWVEVVGETQESSSYHPEDFVLESYKPIADTCISDREKFDRITMNLDHNVESVFMNSRSLGVIQVSVCDIEIKRGLGGRLFVFVKFIDADHKQYNWLAPDMGLVTYVTEKYLINAHDQAFKTSLLQQWREALVYFTISLTLPRKKFPGQFNGCQPLIAGVHVDTSG